MTRERVRPHHDPIDVIGDMAKERGAIAMLETRKYVPHESSIDCHG
jgi:hypothetical protein